MSALEQALVRIAAFEAMLMRAGLPPLADG